MKHGHRILIGGLVAVGLAVALILLAAGGQGAQAQGTVIYVDVNATGGANNGTSWADAYLELYDALGVAASGDEIWVAQGTYKPTSWTDRRISFHMKNGVAIYGGFSPEAGDIEWDDRDWVNHATILSGDIGITGDSSDNSIHVLYNGLLDSTAVLDGFTVTGGNADGVLAGDSDGGGMFNNTASPTLRNCTFEGNAADHYGGGMYNMWNSSPTVTNCTFRDNWAATGGGGMANWSSSAPTLASCTFEGNSAGVRGGGMMNLAGSSAKLGDVTFVHNVAGYYGGGMSNWASSPTVDGCTFEGNSSAVDGGGMHNANSSAPTLTDCAFTGNLAAAGGGGMYNDDSAPELSACTFVSNSADTGGAVYNMVSYAELYGCTIANNTATSGAGMYNNASWPLLIGCTFAGNSANSGGGMYNFNFSSPTLSDCTFQGNLADVQGGGMLNYSSSPVLTNCRFSDNESASFGGGMSNVESSAPLLINCTFDGNSAKGGGGMHNDGFSSPVLTNCTLWGNDAGVGGGMLNEWSSPVLANCILWGNSPDQISDDASSVPVVTYSDVQGGYPGTGNIDADPLFVNAPIGDFHLGPGSPCIDAGDNTAAGLPLRDFEGDPRVLDGDGDGTAIVDMGIDEVWVPPPPVIYVDQDASGINSGLSWADAFTDLQLALDWAVGGVEIWVAEGTYKPTVEHGGSGDRFRSFQMVNGVAIYGGFDPSTGDDTWQKRDWTANVTILSGDLNGDDGPDFANNYENSYHVLFHPWELALDSGAILDGFTITGGNANLAPDDGLHNRGGGMGNFGASPTVANCIFRGNSAAYRGGGMFNNTASPVVTNCTFSGNRAELEGGGMSNWASSPTVTGCTFAGNWTDGWGGGMRNAEGSAPTVIDCAFLDNEAGGWGGGMVNLDGSVPVLTNCTFSGNRAVRQGGGGMYNRDASPVLTNCTFWGNSATSGGGIFNDATSAPTVTNCILWGDTAGGLPSEITGGSALVAYSDVEGGHPGTGNLDADPLFVDPASGDFHLGPGSPCIDVGNNAAPDLPDSDFEGDGRILDGDGNVLAIVDMGVDEVAITWPYFRSYLPLVLGGY